MNLIQEKWDEIILNVKNESEITDVSFNTWIKPLEVLDFDGNKLLITNKENDTLEFLQLVKRRFLPFFKDEIYNITGIECDIDFVLYNQYQKNNISDSIPINKEKTPSKISKYTFETFVVGSNNKFAHSACLAVAESPGIAYNPLFLYGGVGLGKTHLMRSVERYILDHFPEKKVLYTTSEIFTNELIDALRFGNNNSMSQFRNKYRNIDVLLIDDIQFIIGKESTQEEFFHTFNALTENNSQIIISSDKPPKDFETLEIRLKTRFEQGLIADIQPPDYETRMAILRNKEEMDGIFYSNEIIEYIATNIKSSIRELEGALTKLNFYSKLSKEEITLDIAEKELQNFIFPDSQKEITIDLIAKTVSEHFHVTIDDIISSKRQNEIAYPRQIIMYLSRTMTSTPLQDIGKYLGNRDHTTVMHGVDKISKDISNNKKTEELINVIKKKINPN